MPEAPPKTPSTLKGLFETFVSSFTAALSTGLAVLLVVELGDLLTGGGIWPAINGDHPTYAGLFAAAFMGALLGKTTQR